MNSLKQLVDETTVIKDELITCHSKLKNKLAAGEIEIKPGEKLMSLIEKIPDFITVEKEVPTLRLFHANPDGSNGKLYELDTKTLVPIKTINAPVNGTRGIGGGFDGNKPRLFCGASNKVMELNPDTLEVIKTSGFINNTCVGGGFDGKKFRLYYTTMTSEKIYEIDPDTFSSIKSVYSPGVEPLGIGGGFDGNKLRLYHTDASRLYEIDPDTLKSIKTISKSFPSIPKDIGGGFDDTRLRIFCTETNEDTIKELDIETLQVIKSDKAPGLFTEGIDGAHYIKKIKYIDIKR